MTFKEKAYTTCKEEMHKAGYQGKLVLYEKSLEGSNFEAHTNMISNEIKESYNPKVVELKGETKVLKILKDANSHEITHHGEADHPGYKAHGCPKNVNIDHDSFFLPMYHILSKKGFSSSDVDYATNALQDTILHRDLKVNEKKNLEGIVYFFEDVGENTEQKKFTKFYEAHAKLNMYLWGSKTKQRQLGKFYNNDKKVSEVLEGFFSDLKKEAEVESTTEAYTASRKAGTEWINRSDTEIPCYDKEKLQNFFLDENNWEKISEVYAKHFSKLMTKGYAMPTSDHSGAGTKGRESEDNSEEGNPFKKERESENFKKARIMEANANQTSPPEWIDKGELLRIYYEGLAEQIELRAESYTNPEAFPITWYGERSFDPEKDNFKNVHFNFGENGEAELKKRKHSLDVPISIKSAPQSFPEIKFGMIDVSVSMLEDILGGTNVGSKLITPVGDNSKYHWGALTQMGIFEYFKRNHLLTQESISSAFFSSNTEVVRGYKNVVEKLLHPSFGNSTNLDLNAIKSFFEGEGNLIYTIGDGEIQNWSSIKTQFVENAKKHAYVHLHMGTENNMTRDLKKAGLEVVIAEDGIGLPEKVIDITDKIIRRTA